MDQAQSDTAGSRGDERLREVRYQASSQFAAVLRELGSSLVISTYQAGKLVVLGESDGHLTLSFHNFNRPMGVAYRDGQLAVAARNQIWYLDNAPEIARRLEPPGTFDACLLARRALVTGEIQAHEVAWIGAELWIANTLFSCLCTVDGRHSFVARWRPPFITQLAAEDRCHLNGLAVADGRVRYATAMSQTDSAEGWRPTKSTSGCLIDVQTNRVVADDFAMPHSPRVVGAGVLVLDSGRGTLVRVNPADGSRQTIADMPGYTRGLAVHRGVAFVGLSKIRETSTFGGVPIAARASELRCGVGVVDLTRGQTIATFEFVAGVDEIFDLCLLVGMRRVALRGPHAHDDGQPEIWLVPRE
jgi:uncharacterized protein (TIGR03032 family)